MSKGKGTVLTPGQKSPLSGQGVEVGPRGGKKSITEVTVVEGKRVPPVSEPGNKIKIVDPTKHKS